MHKVFEVASEIGKGLSNEGWDKWWMLRADERGEMVAEVAMGRREISDVVSAVEGMEMCEEGEEEEEE